MFLLLLLCMVVGYLFCSYCQCRLTRVQIDHETAEKHIMHACMHSHHNATTYQEYACIFYNYAQVSVTQHIILKLCKLPSVIVPKVYNVTFYCLSVLGGWGCFYGEVDLDLLGESGGMLPPALKIFSNFSYICKIASGGTV